MTDTEVKAPKIEFPKRDYPIKVISDTGVGNKDKIIEIVRNTRRSTMSAWMSVRAPTASTPRSSCTSSRPIRSAVQHQQRTAGYRLRAHGAVMPGTLGFRELGQMAYEPVWQAMQRFTNERGSDAADEIWLVEHPPVFTQGQAGKAEHLLLPGDIPVVQVDRGGQVTYHGPGQLVAYLLLDVRKLGLACVTW
jgi:putative lipoic acid-binding regulatory protein